MSSATSRLRLDFHHIKVDFKKSEVVQPLVCVCFCVCMYLKRASLSLSACKHFCVRQRLSAENGARVPKRVQMINFHSMLVKLIR